MKQIGPGVGVVFKWETPTPLALFYIHEINWQQLSYDGSTINIITLLLLCGTAVEPHVVSPTVGLSVSYETGARFVQRLSTVDALEARRVPFEVRRHAQQVLVTDASVAARTRRHPSVVVGRLHGWSHRAGAVTALSCAVHCRRCQQFCR